MTTETGKRGLPPEHTEKQSRYKRLLEECARQGLDVDAQNSASDCPWGGYIRLQETSLDKFLAIYWTDSRDLLPNTKDQRLDPKFLLVAPHQRLSLQYHHRRSEYWRVLEGPVKVTLGRDAEDLSEKTYETGDIVTIPCGHWHRLTGLADWAVIAELWAHTDPHCPSDEADIVRTQDDYSRTTHA